MVEAEEKGTEESGGGHYGFRRMMKSTGKITNDVIKG